MTSIVDRLLVRRVPKSLTLDKESAKRWKRPSPSRFPIEPLERPRLAHRHVADKNTPFRTCDNESPVMHRHHPSPHDDPSRKAERVA